MESTIIIKAIFTIFVLKVVEGFSSGNPENTPSSPAYSARDMLKHLEANKKYIFIAGLIVND